MKLHIVLFVLCMTFAYNAGTWTEGSGAVRLWKREVSDTSRVYLSKMTTCVRNRFGSTSTHLLKQERCVYRHMKRTLETRDRVSCKFCDRYFFCRASAESKSECGAHHHVKATLETVADCPEVRNMGIDGDESPIEAVELGWDSGACHSNYLCSTGCRFAGNNDTCSLICR